MNHREYAMVKQADTVQALKAELLKRWVTAGDRSSIHKNESLLSNQERHLALAWIDFNEKRYDIVAKRLAHYVASLQTSKPSKAILALYCISCDTRLNLKARLNKYHGLLKSDYKFLIMEAKSLHSIHSPKNSGGYTSVDLTTGTITEGKVKVLSAAM